MRSSVRGFDSGSCNRYCWNVKGYRLCVQREAHFFTEQAAPVVKTREVPAGEVEEKFYYQTLNEEEKEFMRRFFRESGRIRRESMYR